MGPPGQPGTGTAALDDLTSDRSPADSYSYLSESMGL